MVIILGFNLHISQPIQAFKCPCDAQHDGGFNTSLSRAGAGVHDVIMKPRPVLPGPRPVSCSPGPAPCPASCSRAPPRPLQAPPSSHAHIVVSIFCRHFLPWCHFSNRREPGTNKFLTYVLHHLAIFCTLLQTCPSYLT